jgi:transcriptional regulator with XRE-family HTH domain
LKPDARIDEHLGQRLRQRRRHLGLTQGDLARDEGVRFQQIQKYECGATAMSASRLWRLAASLGVPVSYFFQGMKPAAAAATSSPGSQAAETAELVQTLLGLREEERRRLLDLMNAMGREPLLASDARTDCPPPQPAGAADPTADSLAA